MKTLELTLEQAVHRHSKEEGLKVVDYFYHTNTTIIMYAYKPGEVLYLTVQSHEIENYLQEVLEEHLPTYPEEVDLPNGRTEIVRFTDWNKFFDEDQRVYIEDFLNYFLELHM